MALRTRTPLTPRIYCLSLPGTIRQQEMAVRLPTCRLPWEFVYGDNVPDSKDIRWDEVCKTHWTQSLQDKISSKYLHGVAGCKRGVIRCLEKGLADGESGFIVCNDDVIPQPGMCEIIADAIAALPPDVGILGLCYAPFGSNYLKDVSDMFYQFNTVFRMEWMFFIRRWFVKEYIHALNTESCESDICLERYLNKNPSPAYGVKLPAAILAESAQRSIIGYNRHSTPQ